jgi:hypothetical protein
MIASLYVDEIILNFEHMLIVSFAAVFENSCCTSNEKIERAEVSKAHNHTSRQHSH